MRVIVDNSGVLVDCDKCRSVLAVAIEDLQMNDSGHGPSVYVDCPLCRSRVAVPIAKIPQHWRVRLDLD